MPEGLEEGGGAGPPAECFQGARRSGNGETVGSAPHPVKREVGRSGGDVKPVPPRYQNGFTITITTIRIRARVGTSFIARQ